MRIYNGIPPITHYGEMAIDLEIFRANPRQLHRPTGEFACLGISDGKTVYMIDNAADVEKALHNINDCCWIFHNAAFDIRHLRRWADIPDRPNDSFFDTYLIEKLLYANWYDSFGLRDLARRWLGVHLDKEVRDEFTKAKELTPAMRNYAARDPYTTYKIWRKQRLELIADKQTLKVWDEIDRPFFWATLRFKGIYLNQRKWIALADKWQAVADEISGQLKFNPNSPPQVLRALQAIGLNIKDSREATLEKHKDRPLVNKILDYREAAKRVSTYGRNMLDYIEADGRIYTNINTLGAITGRTASDSPNLQNQPNEVSYRECYEAERGNKLLSADYDGQESNIAAELSQDREMIRALEAGEKLHLTTGRAILHDPDLLEYDKHGKKTWGYKVGKTLNLGLSYGLTAGGLVSRVDGLEYGEAIDLIAEFFRTYWGLGNYINTYRRLGRKDGYVRSKFGRKMYLNWYGYKANNEAINAPIQGGGADMIKLSIIRLYKQYGPKHFPIIGPIHDEDLAEIETPKAPKLKHDIVAAMEAAYHVICPSLHPKRIVEIYVGKNWGGKG